MKKNGFHFSKKQLKDGKIGNVFNILSVICASFVIIITLIIFGLRLAAPESFDFLQSDIQQLSDLTNKREEQQAPGGEYDKDAVKENLYDTSLYIDNSGNFYGFINSKPYFPNKDSKGSLYIQSPEENECNMMVIIYSEEYELEFYSSGLIRPGYSIKQAKLDYMPEEPGIYECKALFKAYDTETGKEISTFSEDIKLYIGVKP